MSIQVTKKWSSNAGGFKPDIHAWVKSEVYEITNCPDEVTARAALAGAPFGIMLNAKYPLNSNLRCTGIDPHEAGFNFWQATVTWSIPLDGDATSNDDPLQQPIELSWEPGSWSDPSEIDPEGNPILNMAGDPFEPTPIDKPTMVLVARKYVPYYDAAQASLYQGAINSDDFTLIGNPMSLTIPEGQCRCQGIRPGHPYKLTAAFIRIEARFAMRPNQTTYSGVQADAWDIRKLNQGYNGWYTDPTTSKPQKGKFHTANDGAEVTTPVPLDEVGLPIGKGYTVTSCGYAPIANPSPPVANQDVYLEIQMIGNPPVKVVFVHYFGGVFLPFTGLV